jgi:pyruvoyl-dependent arginine decarboxylase (PvlArgDC)
LTLMNLMKVSSIMSFERPTMLSPLDGLLYIATRPLILECVMPLQGLKL